MLKAEAIVKIFERLMVLFGDRFAKFISDEEAYQILFEQWCRVLKHLTIPQLEVGIELIENDVELQKYFPTAAVYRNLCLKAFHKTPNFDDAYKAALNRNWIHALVWHAYNAVGGSWTFTHEADAKLRIKFKEKYDELEERLFQGEYFNSPDVVMVEQIKPVVSEEEKKAIAEKALAEMKAILKKSASGNFQMGAR